MKRRIIYFIVFFISILFIITACEDDPVQVIPATVFFTNNSGYRVDIYKNLNPVNYDPSTWVCTISAGSTVSVQMYPSYDQILGDAFIPRYKVQLVDGMDFGTLQTFIDAERTLYNITIVIEEGKTYINNVIPEPEQDQLKFLHSYIEINNAWTNQIYISRGTNILSRIDTGNTYIGSYRMGYYEIQFPYYSNTLLMNQLKAFSSSDMPFPVFEMEKGKIYSFIVNSDGTVTAASTAIKNIVNY